MNTAANRAILFLIAILSAFAIIAAVGSAQDYKALEGIDETKTIFDFRDAVPESALAHLQLIHETFNDPAIRDVSKEPDFVVVFMAGSVKLLSSDRNGYSDEEKQNLEQMDKLIKTMAEEGIRLEICEVAAHYFEVDPQTVPREIERVKNGWIASLGYQHKGYALVPVY